MSRITIHDVSKAAGVSIKTVSRVLNSEPNVRSETRARVLKLVEELNYHPSLSARSLAGRSSNLIGLIYQNPSANYVVDLQKGALERCHTRGYRLLVHPCEGNDLSSVRDLAGLVLESHLDGVVLAPPLSDSTEVLAELSKHRIRFVRIAPTVDLDNYSCVFMNDVAAAREMTEYLIALGHERIGFINGPAGHPVTEQRYLGYTLALRSHGLDVDPQLVDRGEFTFDSGLAAARRLLSRATRPTAVFASNDDMAAGTIMAAHEMGLYDPAIACRWRASTTATSRRSSGRGSPPCTSPPTRWRTRRRTCCSARSARRLHRRAWKFPTAWCAASRPARVRAETAEVRSPVTAGRSGT